jgi:hypothetical protein
MKNFYRKPTMQSIGSDAEKLYALETKRNELIKQAASEQGKILGFSADQFWTHSLPEQLASVLGSFDKNAASIAAIAFLEKEGFTITVI